MDVENDPDGDPPPKTSTGGTPGRGSPLSLPCDCHLPSKGIISLYTHVFSQTIELFFGES